LALKLEDQSAQVEEQRLADLALAAQPAAHAAALQGPRAAGVAAPRAQALAG